MRRRNSSSGGRRSSTLRRRSENLRFDEFGFALCSQRKAHKLHHRCHDYSYPQLSPVRVKELCELLSYWNGASFICKSQIERFVRMGIPPHLRGRVWKCLLNTDSLRETSNFNYQKCLSEVRGPLVDLGVSEYGILSAIATLSETQNDLGLSHHQSSSCPETSYSVDDITVFRQITLDLQRSFPTHRSLMGESPEAIEGQAKLFRVLVAYAKYNPHVGYSQGMSYIAAVLLMQLEEEEAFWSLTALLDNTKYLAQLFDVSFTKVQHQVKMFDQFLKHRKPQLSQHMESVGVLSVHFVMPWFLTLFTSLPCWDSVLAVWDLIILHGLSALFRTALTIIELLEPKLMELNDEGALLPLLLRVPVDVAQYMVLVPALWTTEVQDWELKCMNSLVLEESCHEPKEENCVNWNIPISTSTCGAYSNENISMDSEEQKATEKESLAGAKKILTRVMRFAECYILNPIARQKIEDNGSQTQPKPRPHSSSRGQVFKSWKTTSLTQAQIRSRRQSQRRVRAQQQTLQGSRSDVNEASFTPTDEGGYGEDDRTLKRTDTGPFGKVSHRRSNHSLLKHTRVRSLHVQRTVKNTASQTPTPSTVRPSSPIWSLSTPPSSAPRSGHQQESRRTALPKKLSSRNQASFPFCNTRASKLI